MGTLGLEKMESIHFLKSLVTGARGCEHGDVSMGMVVRGLEHKVGSMGTLVWGQKCGEEAWNKSVGMEVWERELILFWNDIFRQYL